MIKVTYHIYEIRTAKKMTLRDLSEKSGVSKSQINDIENGFKHPSVLTLCELAYALDVQPEALFSWFCPQ